MPVRKSSAASPHHSFSSPPARLRSPDVPHDTHSISEQGSYIHRTSTNNAGNGESSTMSGEQKVVNSLVSRLVNKLPCNSGTRLNSLEADPVVRSAEQSLYKLARLRLPLVVQALVGALESLSKHTSSNASLADTSLETLHSQTIILHLLHRCLSASWRLQAQASPPPPADLPRCWPDPAPFDDQLARYLLNVILLYTRMLSAEMPFTSGTASPAPSRETKGGTTSSTSWSRSMAPNSNTYCLGVRFLQHHSYPPGISSRVTPDEKPKQLSTSCSTTTATISQMTKYTARIIFYLSSSNWSLVLSRIKSRISYLTTTIDDYPDFTDLRLLEWANVDRTRLSQVIQEISSVFLHVKRPAQVVVATMLRRAIWNWIDVHPADFEVLVESNRKLEGGADVLFDVLHSMSDLSSSSSARRTKAFYPLMAMLLVVTPDLFKRVVMGEQGGRSSSSFAKKVSFIDSLRKGLGTSKGYEAAVICYVDLVRAGTAVSPRLETAGARSLVLDIQSDLKSALFYSSMSFELSDQNTIVEALVALYRYDSYTIANQLFPKLWTDMNDASKVIGIKACIALTVEDERLPWYPSVSQLRTEVAPAIRGMFKSQAGIISGDRFAVRRIHGTPELPSGQSDVLGEILTLYALDPQFAFTGASSDLSSTAMDSLSQLFSTLSSLTIGPIPDSLRTAAVRTNVALIESIREGVQNDERLKQLANSANDAIWQTLYEAGRQLLFAFHDGDPDDMSLASAALRDTSAAILRLLDTDESVLLPASKAQPYVLVASIAGCSAIISPDVEQTAQALPALSTLGKITTPVHMTGPNAVVSAGVSPSKRINAFEALATLPTALGRQQQQRQIRRTLRPLGFANPVTVAIWAGLAAIARSLTAKIIAADADSTMSSRDVRRKGLTADIEGLDELESKEWQNLMLLLCAFANFAVYDTTPPPSISDIIGKGVLPPAYDMDKPDPLVMIDVFVRQCVDLLLCNSITVKETVKAALGSELPTTMCRFMVAHMTRILTRARGPAGINLSEAFTTFVGQTITILRLSVDRMGPNDDVPPSQVDIGELLYMLAQYVHRLGRHEASQRLKTRLCQLVETALQKSDYVILSSGARFRNAMLEWMGEWSADITRDYDPYPLGQEGSKAQRDLKYACIRAMVPVTDGLVLKAGDEAEDSQGVVKSRLFHRHYQYLVRIIERASHEEEENSSHYTPSLQGQPLLKPSETESAPTLAILVLTNLLSANIDVGLKHCLSLGYHPDSSLRTAFMQLLTKILQQGTRFGGLNTKRISSAPKPYLDALSGPSLALAVAMVDVCPQNGAEVDELSSLLFKVFEGNGTLLGLMRVLIEREIAQTNHESELFRANSITMRMLTLFAKTYGYNYVRATLQPFIRSLIEKPEECSFELDPSKASGSEDIERNADHLRLMCQALLDLICSSTPRVPLQFRALCHHLWEVVDDRFPDSRHSAVGSFIFLRFFCPAIVSPESIDLNVNPDTRETRRALLLITKVIQNLANNVLFKEPHMKVLNSFLSGNIRQVTKFLSDIAIRPKTHDLQAATKACQDLSERAFEADADNAVIHRFVFKHKAKLEQSFLNMPRSYKGATQTKSSRTELDGRTAWENLKVIMEENGAPADHTPPTASARIQMFSEFMRNNQGRSTDSVAEAFYEGPASQNGRRIFYFINSRVALVDLDLVAYHVFQTLDGIKDYFDIIIDLTDLSASTEVPMTNLRRMAQMCPPDIVSCVHTTVLYNPNTYARRRLRRIIPELAALKLPFGKNVIAASSPIELADSIPFTKLALPELTMTLAYDNDQVFSDLLMMSDHEMQVPVIVKLGQESLHIASWRKQDLSSNIKGYIIDMIKLTEIDDVVTGNIPHNQLRIKYAQGDSVTLISPLRNELAQAIRAARARLREAPTSDRALRPSDVPATLLNVALLNLNSSDETLRLGAYVLINELCQFFKYDVGPQILSVSTGLTIPHNSLAYVQSLSSSLATSAQHLTLEFLKEWVISFSKAETPQKTSCLYYVGPWLANIGDYSKPSREDGVESIKLVGEIVRSLLSITLAERSRLHLSLQQHVWAVLGRSHESFTDVIVPELLHAAVDAGLGSDKVECVGDILTSVASTTVRGKVIARLRKTLAQTYLKPSSHLTDNVMWSEICALSRIALPLSFNPASPLDTQLFLAETFHIITLLLGIGPVLMRQTIYGLMINTLHSLTSNPSSGDMDATALQHLLKRSQQSAMMAAFGLVQGHGSIELSGLPVKDSADVALLDKVEEVAKFFGEVLVAAAVSVDCANAWRARWMGLVAATCFQHNPSTQPQAFTVLGYLASDEVDDDLVYQILVAMSTTLSHFTESDFVLITSMLRCLSRTIPGLLGESRYAGSLFWLAIGILQLSYVPLFAPALELMITALKSISSIQNLTGAKLFEQLMEAREMVEEEMIKLDSLAGVTFSTDISFSLNSIVYKGVRHPSTKSQTIEALFELLKVSSDTTAYSTASTIKKLDGDEKRIGGSGVTSEAVPFFVALLSVLATSGEEVKKIFGVAGSGVEGDTIDLGEINLLQLFHIEDKSKAVLLVSLVVSLLIASSVDAERVVLYRFLADVSADMPDVLAMAYDTLLPRLTSTLSTTSNISILRSTTTLLERAISDPTYAFASPSSLPSADSSTSLHLAKPYAASISSQPSTNAGHGASSGLSGTREQVLEDLGMKGVGELGFPAVKADRLAMMARWVAALIDSFTS